MKKIVILGSTGSIGRQALQIVEKYPDTFEVVALTAHGNADLLIAQARKFSPAYVGVSDPQAYTAVRKALSCEVGCGEEVLAHAAALKCDVVLAAVVGCAGLLGVLSAIEHGTNVALANKEALVAGGELVTRLAAEKGVKLLPVDSEHSAVWQCLSAGKRENVRRLILTASGGPFYKAGAEELQTVTPERAVAHPTWRMGRKISVDSATMMNKGLEIIEARWLFDTQDIDYVIHPQSIIHSMVEFVDGAVIAQLSYPDMRLPIQLALTYPDRMPTQVPPLPLGEMTFLPPREDLFPLPKLAKRALQTGGNATTILNAANEAAVQLFLDKKISFPQISTLVEYATERMPAKPYHTAADVFATHKEVYDMLMTDYTELLRGAHI